MKALSIEAGFALCIVAGVKTIECRTWSTNYRGDIMICSTAKKIHGTIPSHALGIVTLKDIVPFTRKHLKEACMRPADYSKGCYAWILENPRLIKPIPVKGKLSLWEFSEPYEIVSFNNEDEEEAFCVEYWDSIMY